MKLKDLLLIAQKERNFLRMHKALITAKETDLKRLKKKQIREQKRYFDSCMLIFDNLTYTKVSLLKNRKENAS